MPTLISQSEVRVEWKDIESRIVRERPKLKRSSGIHLSGVIKYVLTTSGLLDPDDLTDEIPLRMCVGMAFEDWIVGLYPDMIWQPGECLLQGVCGSPDGISAKSLEEFKATWKSSHTRQDITKERIWMWQLAGYCKMMQLTKARLHVLWINGDYRPPAPKYMTYLLRFEQVELDRFWNNVILKNKDNAVPEIHADA